jgi:hypothetical protein
MGGVTCTTGIVLCLYHYWTSAKYWHFIHILYIYMRARARAHTHTTHYTHHTHIHTPHITHTHTHTHHTHTHYTHTHTLLIPSVITLQGQNAICDLCCLISLFLPEILNNVINLTDKGCSLIQLPRPKELN